MKISSKYDIGDIVWYISNNKVNWGKVRGVYINIHPCGVNAVRYTLNNDDIKRNEETLFNSKEELIKSL